MNEWRIWVLGDLDFMEQILNGLAMIVGDAGFTEAIAVGFMLGGIAAACKCILSGDNRLQLGWVVGAGLFFAVGFGTTTTVHLEDSRTNQFAVVDNVPMGPALAGSITSHLGYYFTQAFEQVFSYPSMLENGMLTPLRGLQKSYGIDYRQVEYDSGNADFAKSVISYLSSCTLRAIRVGDKTPNDLRNAANIWQEMRWEGANPDQTVLMYLDDGAKTYNCNGDDGEEEDGLDALTDYRNGTFNGPFMEYLTAHMADSEASPNSGYTPTSPTGTSLLSNALNPFVGGTAQPENATEFAHKIAVMNVIPAAIRDFSGRMNQNIHDMGVGFQSPAQRNYQFAAEGSVFQDTVLPMMTFLEGFIYAIGPFAAVALTLGPAGASIVGKYVMTALWLQSFMPVFALINLYYMVILDRFGTQLVTTQNGSSEIAAGSISGSLMAQSQIQDWLGTAGLLQASVPGLTMMIIYGTSVSAAHMSSRLNSADTVNANATARTADVAPGSSMFDGLGKNMVNERGNAYAPNQGKVDSSIQLGASMENATQGSEARLQQAQKQAGESAQQVFASGATNANTAQDMTQMSNQLRASGGQVHSAISSESQEIMSRLQEQGVNTDGLQQITEGALSGGLSLGAGGASAGGQLSQRIQDTYGLEETTAKALASEVERSVSEDSGFQSELASAVSHDLQNSSSESFVTQASEDSRESLEKSYSRMEAERAELQESQSLAASVGASRTLDYGQFQSQIQASPDGTAGFVANSNDLIRDVGGKLGEGGAAALMSERDDRVEQLMAANDNMDQTQARAFVNAEILTGAGGYSTDDLSAGDRAAMTGAAGMMLSDAVTGNELADSSTYMGRAGEGTTIGSVGAQTPDSVDQGAPADPDTSGVPGAGDVSGAVAQGQASTESRLAGGRSEVNQAGAANERQAAGLAAGDRQNQADEHLEQARAAMNSAANNPHSERQGEATITSAQYEQRLGVDQETMLKEGAQHVSANTLNMNPQAARAAGALAGMDQRAGQLQQQFDGLSQQSANYMAFQEIRSAYSDNHLNAAMADMGGGTVQQRQEQLSAGMSADKVSAIQSSQSLFDKQGSTIADRVANVDKWEAKAR